MNLTSVVLIGLIGFSLDSWSRLRSLEKKSEQGIIGLKIFPYLLPKKLREI
ncbi:MAG: hypothetical protein ABH867_01175 [Patescibacteria group bacterium]|nr:hypothetical protein [Patescibacteria group bacterium]